MSELLITGATGFIGSHLLESLLKDEKYSISITLRNASRTERIDHLLNKCKIYNIDKTSLEEIFKKRYDGVINLAAYYVKKHSSGDIVPLINSNILFPTALMENACKNSVGFFINTGTFFEYNLYSNPIREVNELDPFNLYAATKTAFTDIMKYYSKKFGINILNLRLATPYGFKDNQKLIPFLILSILKDKVVELEKGEQEWDFIYIRDVVEAYKRAIQVCSSAKRTLYEDILIGTGQFTSVRKITEILNSIHNKKLIKLEKDYKENQIFLAYVDNSKAKNLLQWIPHYAIEDGLEETYKLYRDGAKHDKR